jgi:hypothetical protein
MSGDHITYPGSGGWFVLFANRDLGPFETELDCLVVADRLEAKREGLMRSPGLRRKIGAWSGTRRPLGERPPSRRGSPASMLAATILDGREGLNSAPP